jgi:hypothetical protein
MSSQLEKIMERLNNVKSEFKTLLNMEDAIISCYCAPLPVVDMDEKRNEQCGHYDPQAHLYGKTAIDTSVINLLSFIAPARSNTFHPLLSPGLVQIRLKYMQEAERILALMNTIKDEFSLEIGKIKDSRIKHETIHNEFPMLMTKQVTRHVNYVRASESLISMSYSFAAKTDSKIIQHDDALILLKNDTQGLQNLNNMQNLPLRIRRVKTRRIYANCLINIEGSKRNKPKQLQGAIPIIASNAEDVAINVRPYTRNKKKASGRTQTANYSLISAVHHLYAKIID